MDISDLFGAIGGAVSGGITGIAGTALSGWFQSRRDQSVREHELAMRRMDIESDRAEAAAAQAKAETYVDAERRDAQATERMGSYQSDRATYLQPEATTGAQNWVLVIVDSIRGVMRPGLTAWFAFNAVALIGVVLVAQEAAMMVIYLSGVTTTWWFGDRMVNKNRPQISIGGV